MTGAVRTSPSAPAGTQRSSSSWMAAIRSWCSRMPSGDWLLSVGYPESPSYLRCATRQRGHFRAHLLQNQRRQRDVALLSRDFLPGSVDPA